MLSARFTGPQDSVKTALDTKDDRISSELI